MRATGFRIVGAGLCCAGLAGCAGFWDEVTSRDFDVRNIVSPPDPMTVLKTSTDGDARAKAFRRLEEPRRRGGSEADQEEVVKLLSATAISDPQPICRMAAIATLGRFQDPRTVAALAGAYESADQLVPDVACMVRCQTLQAMGETKQPTAVEFLTEIAKKPSRSDVTERERGQGRDIRLAAVRSLQNFPGSPVAADAVAGIARQDKDVAIRDRARETYEVVTGKPVANEATTPPTAPTSEPIQAVGYRRP